MSKEFDLNESNINQLYLLYKNEFINYCENILIENQNEFLDKFYAKMDLIMKNNYGENIFDKIPSLYLTKKQCENKFITDIYWPMHNLCLNSKNNFYSNSNDNKSKYLINFRPHCFFDQVPLHTCGSKFIPVFNNDKNNKIIYVICSGCDKCYYSNCIIMNCHYCQIDFYSEVINIKNNLFYATWKKYHCNNDKLLINEKMHCIICNNLLYIKNNKLFCKICKEYFDPEEIVWTCKVCKTEFKSDIKIFNPYEFKEIEIIKKEAFLYKKISKPNYTPCNCIYKNNISNTNFYHESDGNCKGFMYYCYVNNKEFLVCSLCKIIFELNKFCWKCPVCFKKFIANEINFEEDINKENNNNNFIKKNNKKDINEQTKKIHNSCSQKIIDNNKNVFIKNNKIKEVINTTMFFAIITLVSVLLVGSNSYVKNLIVDKNPFYPLMGHNKVDIMTYLQPASFKNMSPIKKNYYSIFSKTGNIGVFNHGEPELKIPFSFDRNEINQIGYDTRIGGYGVLFSGIFIISSIIILFELIHLVMIKKYENLLLILISMIIIVGLCLFLSDGWWARYAPYLYVLVLISLIIMASYKRKTVITIFALFIVIIQINSFICFKNIVKNDIPNSGLSRINLKELSNKNIEIYITRDRFTGIMYNLDDYKIKYEICKEKRDDMKKLYGNFVYYSLK